MNLLNPTISLAFSSQQFQSFMMNYRIVQFHSPQKIRTTFHLLFNPYNYSKIFYTMHAQSKKITALLCQTHPHFKKREENIARFDELLQFYSEEEQIDIILFPEMSFTGYDFKNYEDALPLAITYGEGPEFQYASRLAKRLKAYVLFGYIEKAQEKGKIVLYNSAAAVDRMGVPMFNTRKTHLYFADELWAQEGQGFKTIEIINTKGQKISCTVGICMDINPKNFTSGKYELADFTRAKQTEVILFPTNWVDSEPNNNQSAMDIYNYWLNRLGPLLKPKSNKHILFLAADRVGVQYSFYDKKEITFMGGSCALSINPHQLVSNIDKKSEKVLKVEHQLPL